MKSCFWKLVRFASVLGLAVWAMGPRAVAQVVEIPDASLRDAIRTALGKPTGDISVADMESLTTLDASLSARGGYTAPFIASLEGLQTARNLTSLDLSGGGAPQGGTVANVSTSALSPLAGLTNLTTLFLGGNQLTNLTFLAGLTSLTSLDLSGRYLRGGGTFANVSTSDLSPLAGLTNLTTLSLGANQLTNLTFLAGLTNLTTLLLGGNQLTNLTALAGLTNLTTLDLYGNQLTNLSFLAGLTRLTSLDLSGRYSFWGGGTVANVSTSDWSPLARLTSLTTLNLAANQLTNLAFLSGLTNLTTLYLSWNQLTNLTLPAGLTRLTSLYLGGNQLTNLTLPAGLTGLTSLATLDLSQNQLTSLTLPAGLSSLELLDLSQNQLTSLTLPVGLSRLIYLFLDYNPLKTFVLSEPLATTSPAGTVDRLRGQGVSIYTYPLAVSLVSPHHTAGGSFTFTLTGPPGLYRVRVTSDFSTWIDSDSFTNLLGSGTFTDSSADQRPQSFYRVKVEP
jgi:Leucine-rich repeat (LRR) protein